MRIAYARSDRSEGDVDASRRLTTRSWVRRREPIDHQTGSLEPPSDATGGSRDRVRRLHVLANTCFAPADTGQCRNASRIQISVVASRPTWDAAASMAARATAGFQ